VPLFFSGDWNFQHEGASVAVCGGGSASLIRPSYADVVIHLRGEEMMKSSTQRLGFWLVTLLLGAGLTASSAFAAKGKTFTGTVSDSMCGAKHEMAGDDARCTRACVSKGSKYALVVGDKVYTLETSDKTALETLDKQAGAKATVTGTVNGDVLEVSSVSAPK
jgi:hypothetical protein